jgi:flavin reductase (DIM6/NTAB) family NADH-FMN oxidoreductase RutF
MTTGPGAERFRDVMSRFATGVTVVSCHAQGLDHAMTANSFTSVSLDPALVLVCVERDSRFHDALLEAGSWSVSVLAATQRGRARWFATRGRPLVGQFDSTPTSRSALTGALVLDGALASLDCRTWSTHSAGDHDIVVGEVLDLADRGTASAPLLYFGHDYRTLREDDAT